MKNDIRIICISVLILAVSLAAATTARANFNDAAANRTPHFFLFSLGYGYLVQELSPISEWEAEIQRLTADEIFIERWVSLNADPGSVQRGQVLLEKTRNQRAVTQQKLSRFKRWFYPAVTLIGTGGLFLLNWILGGSE